MKPFIDRFAATKAIDIVLFYLKHKGHRFAEIRGYKTNAVLNLQVSVLYHDESTRELTLKLMRGEGCIEAKGSRFTNAPLQDLFANLGIKYNEKLLNGYSDMTSTLTMILSQHLGVEVKVEQVTITTVV
jgi:hypothetical protein